MNVIRKIGSKLKHHRRAQLVIVFVIALAIRLMLTLTVWSEEPMNLNDDQLSYDEYARRIVEGDWLGEEISYREVGYPLLLSWAYRVGGPGPQSARVANSLLGALTCLLIFFMARPAFGSTVGLASAAWYAVYFHSIFYTKYVQREVLITLLLVLTLVFLIRALVRGRLRDVVLSALSLVAVIHTDARFLFYVPFVLVMFVLTGEPARSVARRSATFLIVFMAAMVPWQVRNYVVYDQFVLVNTRTLGVQAKRVVDTTMDTDESTPRVDKVAGSENRGGATVGLRQALYDVVELFRVSRFREGVRPGSTAREKQWSPLHNLSSILMYGLLLPFFLYGTWRIVRERSKVGYVFVMVVLAHTILHIVMWGRTRYRVPIEPVMIVVAFYGVLGFIDVLRARHGGAHV